MTTLRYPFAALAGLGFALGCAGAAAPLAPRPNIVLIVADDMGYSDVGCFGSEISTPHIDRLAREGLRFTQFYNVTRCSPSRAAMLSGVYSQQAGLGEVPEYAAPIGGPGYLAHLSDRCVTIAETLRSTGYATYHSGKWHLGRERPHWPIDRGFDRSTALIDCCSNFFGDPEASEERKPASRRERYAIDEQLWRPPLDGYYSTDWFGENAARMIREHDTAKPFFLYLAFTAPHWPLQARPEDVAKFHGRYDAGWDEIRRRRFERMRELGLLDPRWQLSRREGTAPDWKTLDAAKRADWARRMEIYAAMIAVMDENIGRVLTALETRGVADNTLVFFLSDNGATEENPNRGKPGAALGSRDSYHGYGLGWANVSNTPFRRYKHWVHEGGISTPLLARWPKGIARPGTSYPHPAHVIDLMATAVELSGARHPKEFRGQPIVPLEGRSLAPAFRGASAPIHDEPIFWEHQGNAAVRHGRWKLVRAEDGPGAWELYDMDVDRTETTNLAVQYPERVREMRAQFETWAARAQVRWPWPLAPYKLR
ncbi:MAG: arylsulfatase [Opitutaceae bacterium]|nr:arylsulfatase [Opitutaceae bacterium]